MAEAAASFAAGAVWNKLTVVGPIKPVCGAPRASANLAPIPRGRVSLASEYDRIRSSRRAGSNSSIGLEDSQRPLISRREPLRLLTNGLN